MHRLTSCIFTASFALATMSNIFELATKKVSSRALSLPEEMSEIAE